ncbi:SDR family NAD(P)-dependent oxidoreductase [Alkalihalobacillus sp. BA299]|uniref:SDR family NAD(P)-dependent oxidoreductase n=1 Tax=Alkalihalobacillus sp. BA299 TaxID=2815938 RepID=UPI001AD9D313|nr:SDR family oxidoreductase [Alkalihalobacillus sp. BA299]
MDGRLKGEVAIVTGSASGIGKGIAERFLQSGASVLLVDSNKDRLSETSEVFKQKYGQDKVTLYTADLSSIKEIPTIIEKVVYQFGQLNVLVNCAGIYPSIPAIQITEGDWDRVLDLNLKATFFFCQEAAKQMIEQNTGGRIVNITSTASEVARPGVAHYCSSKAAVKILTQVLSLEWASYGIRVNALGPGLVETETLLETLTTEEAKAEHKEKLSYSPMNRTALLEEIAEGVMYFATNQSSFVTGQTLLVDGGYSAGRVFQSKSKKVMENE